MVYNYIFDIAALVINITLILLSCLRKNYHGGRMHAYRTMLFLHFIATVFDIISVYTISYPERYSLTFNYAINLGYYLFHCLSGIAFVLYGIFCEKRSYRMAKARNFWCILGGVEVAAILSTPFTKLVFYFDDALNYCHGPGLYFCYVIAVASIVYVLYLKLSNKEHRNNFEIISNVIYAVVLSAAFAYHTVYPYYLVELFAIDVGLLVMYIAQDNPESYLYKGLSVFNHHAFEEKLFEMCRNGRKFSVLLFVPQNAEEYKAIGDQTQIFAIEKHLIGACQRVLNRRAELYAFSGMCMAVICRAGENEYVSQLTKELNKPAYIDGKKYRFDISFASMKFPDTAKTYNEAIQIVNDLINNKLKKHEGYRVLQADRSGLTKKDTEMIRVVKSALRKENIVVVYQPIISLDTRWCQDAEVHLKIVSGDREIPEEEFLPVAEEEGLLPEIDAMVLLKVCDFLRRSNALGLGINSIGIHLSAAHLRQQDLPERLAGLMAEHDIPAGRICFELTDIDEYEENPTIAENIAKVREYGFHFVLDEFGMDYLSIPQLLQLPLDAIKLDGGVLPLAMEDDRSAGLLRDLLTTLHNVGLKTACDGVTAARQDILLSGLACDYSQGKYYSGAVSEEDYVKFLQEQVGDILTDISSR